MRAQRAETATTTDTAARVPDRRAFLGVVLGLAVAGNAGAQNLIPTNPDFDGGLGGWTGVPAGATLGDDADSCPSSGSFHGETDGIADPSQVVATATDCVPVELDDDLWLEVRYRSPRTVYLYLLLYSDFTCTTPVFAPLADPHPANEDWAVARIARTIGNAEIEAVRFRAIALDDPIPSIFVAEFDRAYLGFAERIFADDFDGGSYCRWTNFVETVGM